MPHVNFIDQGITVAIADGENLFAAARRAEIFIPAPCGGNGTCGKCRIRIVENPTPVTSADESVFSEDELADGWRLACRAIVTEDISVEFKNGHHGEVILTQAAGMMTNVLPDMTETGRLGLAVDLGTTTIAVVLYDLSSGEVIGRAATGNPQAVFGADVIARISHASESQANQQVMQRHAVVAIDSLLDELLAKKSLLRENVVKIFVAGNTTMQHFLLQADASGIAIAPFTPEFINYRELPASEIGFFIAPGGVACVMPAISGYVGGDMIADMLAVGWAEPDDKKIQLLIDIGTNGEIALCRGDKILACSTAAGPAFEGAKISCGTRAIPGAINAVDFVAGDLRVETVEEILAVGMCGTGLLDTVAALLEAGAVDCGGRLVRVEDDFPGAMGKRIISHSDGGSAVILSGDVFITARDIREFQLAKAAISAGVSVLLQNAGLKPSDVDNVLLAGAMGSFLRPVSAIKTGLLPAGFEESQIQAVGNTALEGASCCMLSAKQKALAETLAAKTEYIELSGRLDFQMAYTEAMMF